MADVSITLCSNSGSCESSRIIPDKFNLAKFSSPIDSIIQTSDTIDLSEIQAFVEKHQEDWVVGFISYSVGESIFDIQSQRYSPMTQFPSNALWAFKHVDVPDNILPEHSPTHLSNPDKFKLKCLTSKSAYLQKVAELQSHIHKGDIYEINFCLGFEATEINIEPAKIWNQLRHISPMPFSALLETDDYAIISASPERFIRKMDNMLYCQPMKGTLAKTSMSKEMSVYELKNNPKERSENVMIVDLTRNDLSKIAEQNSVKVDELFGVYEFQTIYQMISTVSAQIRPDTRFVDLIQATFPMGSMTGAPKKRAMELISTHEDFKRSVFSGMLGYIDPQGDADFNVLIRTLFYDKKEKRLFMAVGSAITAGSDPEKEYEECLIKLQPLLQVLNAEI